MSKSASPTRHAAGRRLLALTLSLALALSTLAASYTVDVLRDHDCHGDDCVACHVVGMAHSLLGAQTAPATESTPIHISVCLTALAVAAWWLARAAETPVSLRDLLLI